MKKYIKEVWNELGQPIFVGERLKHNLKVLTGVSIVTLVLGIVLIILDIITKEWAMLIPAIATFLGGASCAYFAGIRKNRRVAAAIPTIFCIVAFTIYAINGMGNGTAIFWTLLMPIGISYFVGVKNDLILSIYYNILFVVLFYTPIRHHLSDSYSQDFMIRFPLLFLSLTVFTLIAMIQYHRMALRDIAYTERLNEEVRKQTAVANERAEKLELMSEETVKMMAVSIDAKDRYTNGHSFRVAEYSVALAKKLGWSKDEIDALWREALLHDIGKIGVPDAVLNNPGRLTNEEFAVIKSHSAIGGKILNNSTVMTGAADVAHYHHERYDGKGYPDGLSGEKIPSHARIVTIADSYDAMRSDRIYRKGLAPDVIRNELVKNKGSQFDPDYLDAFLVLVDNGELDKITDSANQALSKSVELGLFGKATDWFSGNADRKAEDASDSVETERKQKKGENMNVQVKTIKTEVSPQNLTFHETTSVVSFLCLKKGDANFDGINIIGKETVQINRILLH